MIRSCTPRQLTVVLAALLVVIVTAGFGVTAAAAADQVAASPTGPGHEQRLTNLAHLD